MQKSSRLSKRTISYDILSKTGLESSENVVNKTYWSDKDLDNVVKKYKGPDVVLMETDNQEEEKKIVLQDKEEEQESRLNESTLTMERERIEDNYDWKNHYYLMSEKWEQLVETNKMIINSFLNHVTEIPYHQEAFYFAARNQANKIYDLKKEYARETSNEKKENIKNEIQYVQKNMNNFIDTILKINS